MIENVNISNLKLFDIEGYSLPLANDLQKKIQEGIASKVAKLLSQEFIHTFIPDCNSNEDIKLRIHLTKDGITVEILETDTKNIRQHADLSDDIKTRKEKIIKKVNSLFQELPESHIFSKLESEKIHPLSVPKNEQVPFRVDFDANIPNSYAQQIQAKIEALQNQLNQQKPSSEEFLLIRHQLQLLKQAIESLTNKQNIPFSRTEEYAFINGLMDRQMNLCQMFIKCLSEKIHQANLNPQFQDPIPKDIISQLEIEKNALKAELKSLYKDHEKTSQLLAEKQQKILDLQTQLSGLTQEKATLQSEQNDLKSQLARANQNLAAQSALQAEIKKLTDSSISLQLNLLDKDQQISNLEAKVRDLPKPEDLQELQNRLSQLQQEKKVLQLEQNDLKSQLARANQNLATQSALQAEIKKLTNSSTSLQLNLLDKDQQIAVLNEQIQNSSKTYREIQNKLSLLQQEKANLEKKTTLTNKAHEETSQLLAEKQQEILDLQKQLDVLPNLQSQLSALKQEKEVLQLEQTDLKSQLARANQNLTTQSALQADIKKLTASSTSLQTNLFAKDQQITNLEAKIRDLPKPEDLQELQNQLFRSQQEKEILQLEQTDLKNQLAKANQKLTAQSAVQLDRDQQIAVLNEQIQNSSKTYQELQDKLSLLQQEKTDLEKKTTLANKTHKETLQLLVEKQQEILDLQKQLDVLPNLQSQLSSLRQEKATLQSEQNDLKSQLARANQNLTAQSALQAEIKNLTDSSASLQTSLLAKDQQISNLETKIKDLPKHEDFQEIQDKLSLLQQEKTDLEKKTTLTNKIHKETSQLLAEKQQEVLDLQLEQNDLKNQIAQANQNLTTQSDLQNEIEQLKHTSASLQANLFTKDQQIAALTEEMQNASEVHQELKEQLSHLLQKEKTILEEDEKILTLLETAYEVPNNPTETDIITREQVSSSPDNVISEELLNHNTAYYTLTVPEEDSSIENEEKISLQATIANLQAELKNIKPLVDHANNQIQTIERLETSIKRLELELSKKIETTTDLEEKIASLNLQLSKSDTRLKELQRVQHTSAMQQKEIDISSAENTDLLQELERTTKQLFLEKNQIAKLEETYKNNLADLKDLHDENILKRNEIISALINDLEQQQPGSCLILMNRLADYVRFNSITQEEKEDILLLIESAFKNTNEYKNLIASKKEGSSSDDENKGDLSNYEEDPYFFESIN